MTAKIRLIVVLLAFAPCALAQIGVTVGPSPAPVGSPIAVSIANDTPAASFVSSPCPFVVRNAAGAIVFAPFCAAVIVPLAAGQVFTTTWGQTDNSNVPVPPGVYFVDVFAPGGMTTIQITIDATVGAAAAPLGPIRVGRTRQLHTCAPADGGYQYIMAASGFPTSGGIPTCGGTVPLELDALFFLSIAPNPFFTNFGGTIGPFGTSNAPSITVPLDLSLVGISFVVAFIIDDPAAPCLVRRVSAPLVVVIV